MKEENNEIREPTLDEILKKYPPVDEEPELDYEDEDEEEEMDTFFELEPWEKNFYDNDGNYYPDGYLDDEGNVIPGAKKKDWSKS
jgi:hypothetical protein